jgi:subtilisin family serine protease
MRFVRALLTAGTAALLVATLIAAASGAAAGGRPVPGQLAVGYRETRDLAGALRTAGGVAVRWLPSLRVAEIRAPDPARTAAILGRTPGIRFVEQTAARSSLVEPAVSLAADDPAAGWEWQYHATRGDAVPDSVLRAAAAVKIAVIDTGADLAAPDLAAKRPRTRNVHTRTGDVRDTNGHGTFVASLAAGSVTNGDGIAGSGGDTQLLVVKAGSSKGAFTDVDEAAGIVYAVKHGARILNLSVGGPHTSATERRAVRYAVQHGALVVAAAGNDFALGNPVEYPAALLQPVGSDGAGGAGLAVAASTESGQRAPFSNTGSWISLAAPGQSVFADVSALSSPRLYPRSVLPGSRAGLYGYGSGTSFAAPQVAGAAALVWATDPGLTAQQVAAILEQTASGGGTWSPELGYGVLDAAAAVALAQADAAGATAEPR